MSRIRLLWKAVRELGPRQLSSYLAYQLAIRSGLYLWLTKTPGHPHQGPDTKAYDLHPVLNLPDPDLVLELIGDLGLSQLRHEADEIVAGEIRLFGADRVPLDFSLPANLEHWTATHTGMLPYTGRDIKFAWEPARLGWAFTLGRAYTLTADEVYSKAFWDTLESFWENNPPYQGPNWASGQEAALRILALVFAAQMFSPSPHTTRERLTRLGVSVAANAGRVPPTLNYARAQNNNHLLSEAAGLITASLALPAHPQSHRWGRLGWKHFNRGLAAQISPDGTYTQHSTNYHRLILQLALWVQSLRTPRDQITALCAARLAAASAWLSTLVDPNTGRVPNLGPNDGAYILPLTILPFHDYRPVIQAAARVFQDRLVFEPGPWDELGLWLGVPQQDSEIPLPHQTRETDTHMVLAQPGGCSWAYFRAARFDGRPGHADQLHLDLWWRGLNLAQDAGTYLYNADPPWNNALTHTAVHNTVMVAGREQMTRAGRFLYLDQAPAEIVSREHGPDNAWQRITAYHDGYRALGIRHQRAVTVTQCGGWIVADALTTRKPQFDAEPHEFRLHWLLPDWDYEITGPEPGLKIHSPYGWISLVVTGTEAGEPRQPQLTIVRAGETLHGSGPDSQVWGWVSPTYGVKKPALSLGFTLKAFTPLTYKTVWELPLG